jgi:prepilin-type processing-associated H-X9-DG protein
MMGRRGWLSGIARLSLCLAFVSVLGVSLARSAKLSVQQACFANLGRLARATLMYVADNDGRFPPHQAPIEPYKCLWGADNSNPWLRWPVLLDRYLPDRSVYLCEGVEVPAVGHGVATRPGWITTERITAKGWPKGPCASVWPPGWGGAVTDSGVQGRSLDPGRFRSTVGAVAVGLAGRKLSSVKDPRRNVVWADSSRMCANLGSVMWANVCRADCADLKEKADWGNCPWSQKCGAGGDFTTNPARPKAFTRHNGGSNLAFLDGHVEWQSASHILWAYRQGELFGISPAKPTKGQPWYLRKRIALLPSN